MKEWYAVKTAMRRYKNDEPDNGVLAELHLVEAFSWDQAEEKALRSLKARERHYTDSEGAECKLVPEGIIDILCIGPETPTDGAWVWTEFYGDYA